MKRAALIIAALLLAGCTVPQPAILHSGNVDRLLAHPQFSTAAQSAPEFTRDALKTISKLEHDLTITEK